MIQQEKAREYGVYLSQSPHVFEEYLATHFKHTSFDVLSRNYTTETLEEMAFMTAIYKAAGLPDADYKMLRFEEAVPRAKPNGGKRATVMEQLGSAQARADKLDLITAQCNVILEKFNLIDRWIAVASGEFVPILTPDTDLWKHEYFLNYRSMVCRPVLEAMMEDADNILRKSAMDTSLERFKGAEYDYSVDFEKTDISRSIRADLAVQAGAGITAEVKMEYKNLTATFDAGAFAGAQFNATAGASIDWGLGGGAELDAGFDAKIGVIVTANAEIAAGDNLTLGASAEGIAGALASGSINVVVNNQTLGFEASMEIFAGARISGEATCGLSFGGRDVFAGSATAGVSAGFGAKGEFGIHCDLFGRYKVKFDSSATVGIGAELGCGIEFDANNAYYGAIHCYFGMLSKMRRTRMHAISRLHFLDLEENVAMAKKARAQLHKMMVAHTNSQHQAYEDLQRFHAVLAENLSRR